MSYEQYEAKIEDLRALVKNPSATDQELVVKINNIHKWMDLTGFEGDRLNIDFTLSIAREMRALYSKIYANQFRTQEELSEAYYNDLSEEAQEIYWEYEVINDWSARQFSETEYEDYLEILEKPFFSEEELKKAYDLSVDQILYSDTKERMQMMSWPEFRKKYEKKIMETSYSVEYVGFNLVPCEIEKDKWVFMGQTEVTQELFEAVMGWNDSYNKNSSQNPVETVTWYDCIDFCNKLSNLLGLEECYEISDEKKNGLNIKKATVKWDESKNGFRLPTEKEWELFARAGTENKWSGTNEEKDLKDYAWYSRNSEYKTHPVGEKLPNEWGLYDMSGNVWEWCWDLYDPENSARERVMRGGSNGDNSRDCEVASRSCFVGGRYNALGLRLCRSLG